MKKMKTLSMLVILALVMSLLAGCGGDSKAQGGPVREDGSVVLRIPFNAEPSSLDPGFGNSSDSICPRGMMYEGLVRIFDNKIEPAMAESWEVSEDGKTYTFKLRDSKWSDGEPVTAYDFEYGIKRLLDPSEDAPNGNYSWMGYYFENGQAFNEGKVSADEVGVKALDDKTLEVTATKNMPYFLDLMKMPCFYPVRQDIAEQYGKDYASAPDKVVCNGPFVLTAWDHESKLVFEKNPNYWNAENINVDGIEAYIITEQETVMNMFDNGELDITNSIEKEYIDKYKEKDEAVFIEGATVWYNVINVKTDRGEASKLLQNQSFRQAVSYALDRNAIVDAARGDGSFAISRTCPDLMSITDSTLGDKYPLNPYPAEGDTDKAKELFDKALKETGFTADTLPTLTLLTFDDSTAKTTAEIIQNLMSSTFGLSITIDTQTYSARVEKENKGDYDFCITNWAPDYNDPMTFLECYESGNSYNTYFGGYSNSDYDKLIAFCNKIDDMQKRADKLFEAEQILAEEMICVPLFQTSGYWGKKTYVSGISKCGFGANDPDFARVHYDGEK
ncbi:MAG: peptide ABC transporter substrate-binding protein [Emergencia sp.]|nr:peptide ABC transporter substrate-binding protein [Emergencia sp.]